jgi:hypothetical protein
MSSKVWTKLANEGPLPAEKFPVGGGVNYKLREDGVRVFNPCRNSQGSTQSGGGQARPVYYIEGKHSPDAIVKTWLDSNKRAAEGYSDWALYQRICNVGRKFAEASKKYLDAKRPGGYDQRKGEMEESPCPLCGEPVKVLPDHLPCDE